MTEPIRPPIQLPIAIPPMYVAKTVVEAMAVLPKVRARVFANVTSYTRPQKPDKTKTAPKAYEAVELGDHVLSPTIIGCTVSS